METWQKIEILREQRELDSEDYQLHGVYLTESKSMSEYRTQQSQGNGAKNPSAQKMNRMMFGKSNREAM